METNKPLDIKIVGHLGDRPIYELPAMPEIVQKRSTTVDGKSHVCPVTPRCLCCVLNDLIPIIEGIDVNLEVLNGQLNHINSIRIDSGEVELHVETARKVLVSRLAVASESRSVLVATLGSALEIFRNE